MSTGATGDSGITGATGYTGPTGTFVVPIGLQGYLETMDLTTIPKKLYDGLLVPGRYMMVVIQSGLSLIGGIDFIFDGSTIGLISSYNFKNYSSSNPYYFGMKNGDSIVLSYNNSDNNLYVGCANYSLSSVSFKTFIIATTYSGKNICCVDMVTSNTDGAPITLVGDLEMTTTTKGTSTFLDTPNISTWSNSSCNVKRIGKIINIAGKATLTTGLNGITKNTFLDLIIVTPVDKFFNSFPTIGSSLIKNGNVVLNGTIVNDTTDNSIVKLQLIVPENLIEGDVREISFNLSYVVD